MQIKILDLTEKNLKTLPEWESYPFSCKYCLYWEKPEASTGIEKETTDLLFKEKSKWLSRVRKEFGNCGKLIYVDGKPAGFAQFAPPKFFPNLVGYGSVQPDVDAVFISCLFIFDKNYRELGLGTKLLKRIINGLKSKGIKIIETFARIGNAENPSGLLELYLKNGFRIYIDDPEFPLVRIDV